MAAARAKEARTGQNIQIVFPTSGAVLYFDTMAIPVDAPHAENAYTWMSTIYRPQVQAGIVNKVFAANAVRAAYKYVRSDIAANRAFLVQGGGLGRLVPPGALTHHLPPVR